MVLPAYALSRVLLKHGVAFTSLLTKYRPDVDWRAPQHWHCNNNVRRQLLPQDASRLFVMVADGVRQHSLQCDACKWHVSLAYLVCCCILLCSSAIHISR